MNNKQFTKGGSRQPNRRGKQQSKNANRTRPPKEEGRSLCEDKDKVVDKDRTNDPKWYFKYPELLQTAARIPYTLKPGMTRDDIFDVNFTVKQDNKTVSVTKLTQNGITIPGVWTLDWTPSIGVSQSNMDPASVLARELYSRVREAFSGTLTVDAPDLLIQVMALDSIYSMIAQLKRVYRTLNTSTPYNYNYPYGLLYAMGIPKYVIDYLFSHKLRFLGEINNLIRLTQKLVCPSAFDYITRHYWMNDNIFSDGPSESSQLYIFNQSCMYKFELLPTPQSTNANPVLAGGLKSVRFLWGERQAVKPQNPTKDPITYIIDQIKGLIDSLSAWEECYDINGYFLRAFGDTGAFIIEPLREDEKLEYTYDTVVLTQIQNANAAPFVSASDWYSDEDNLAYQSDCVSPSDYVATGALASNYLDKGTHILQDPRTNAVLSGNVVQAIDNDITRDTPIIVGTKDVWLNVPEYMTTPEGSVEASRLHTHFAYISKGSTGDNVTARFTAYSGTEIILQNRVTYAAIQRKGEFFQYKFTNALFLDGVRMIGEDTQTIVRVLVSEAFDWKPLIVFAGVHPSNDINTDLSSWGYFNTDIRQLGTISVPDFQILNQFCLLSQLSAYSLGEVKSNSQFKS